MSDAALAQMIVNKERVELKALLYQKTTEGLTWDGFTKKAEEMAWIAFPDKVLSRVEWTTRVHSESGSKKIEKKIL